MRDFKRLQEDPPAGVSGAPTDNNIMIWNAVIFGPHDTPFEDGTFKLTLEFTEEYPNNLLDQLVRKSTNFTKTTVRFFSCFFDSTRAQRAAAFVFFSGKCMRFNANFLIHRSA